MASITSTASIVVIGAGPAGCVFAARMAELGHDVVLLDREAFPRDRLGESLSPGVLPLVETIGARDAIERAGFTAVSRIATNWDGASEMREPAPGGLLVDRGRFDALLLARARALGVRILQPASVRRCRQRCGTPEGVPYDEWVLRVDAAGRSFDLRASFVADATGRGGLLPRKRTCAGPRTIALHAYWRGRHVPAHPRIEVGTDAWYWGVPLPDGRYNTLAFADASAIVGLKPCATTVFEASLAKRSTVGAQGPSTLVLSLSKGELRTGLSPAIFDRLLAGISDPRLDGRVRAIDATPFLDEASVGPASIKIGDAALAIDPLSSSGVQKAIQSALAGAIVANTLMRVPDSADVAMQFYREHLREASERHTRWAAEHYATVAVREQDAFWRERAATWGRPYEHGRADTKRGGAAPTVVAQPFRAAIAGLKPALSSPFDKLRTSVEGPCATTTIEGCATTRVELSPLVEIVDIPCLDGAFVTRKPALRHPNLERPVAFVGSWDIAPLVTTVRAGMTPLEVARTWSNRMPLASALAVTGWLIERRILVPFEPRVTSPEQRATSPESRATCAIS